MNLRKRDALKSRMDQKLHTALTAEGHVELDLMDLSDAGQRRFDEGNKDGAVDTAPTVPKSPDEIDPNPKKKTNIPSKWSLRRDTDAEIHLNAVLPTRFEDRIAEDRAGGTFRIDYLIRIGLGDVKKINYYRQAIRDPEAAVRNPTLRPFVGEVLERLPTVQPVSDPAPEAGQDPRERAARGRDERFRQWRQQSQHARTCCREST